MNRHFHSNELSAVADFPIGIILDELMPANDWVEGLIDVIEQSREVKCQAIELRERRLATKTARSLLAPPWESRPPAEPRPLARAVVVVGACGRRSSSSSSGSRSLLVLRRACKDAPNLGEP